MALRMTTTVWLSDVFGKQEASCNLLNPSTRAENKKQRTKKCKKVATNMSQKHENNLRLNII